MGSNPPKETTPFEKQDNQLVFTSMWMPCSRHQFVLFESNSLISSKPFGVCLKINYKSFNCMTDIFPDQIAFGCGTAQTIPLAMIECLGFKT